MATHVMFTDADVLPRSTPPSVNVSGVSDDARRQFAVPPATGRYRELDLSLLDPGDEDDRRLLIEAEHPEFWEAFESGAKEVTDDGQTVGSGAHMSIHEIVANQLWVDDPPITWETAQRLVDGGYDRHEILHMIGSAVSDQIYAAMKHGKPFDVDQFTRDLNALPDSWEAMRDSTAEPQPDRTQRYRPR